MSASNPWKPDADFMEIAQYPAYIICSRPLSTSPEEAALLVEYYSSKRRPFEIEVRSNSLTILTNQVAVTRDELHIAGNPFEQYLDLYREKPATISNVFCKEPGSDALYAG